MFFSGNVVSLQHIMGKELLFATSTELLRIPAEAVVFISANGNYSSISMADGSSYVLTMQLGQIERRLTDEMKNGGVGFVRIGKSLIVNIEYITFISPARQKITLSDCRTFRHDLTASREALKTLREHIERS